MSCFEHLWAFNDRRLKKIFAVSLLFSYQHLAFLSIHCA